MKRFMSIFTIWTVLFMGFMFLSFICGPALAENVAVEVVAAPAVAPQAPQVAPQAPPVVKSVDEVKLTVKDEALVPPGWLQDAVVSAKSLPVVGPFLVKAIQWLGVVLSILTALFAFLWTVLRSLQGLASAAKLMDLAEKLAMLENSKFMYYLKAFSAFNAQKKDKPA